MEFFQEMWSNFTQDGLSGILMKVASTFLTFSIGIYAMRLVGRKSLAQATLPTVMFIFVLSSVLGTNLTKPQELLMSTLIAIVLVTMMIIIEKLQIKFNTAEKLLVGQAVALVKDGEILDHNMKKSNITVDQMEMAIRKNGVPSIAFCKTVTYEANGGIAVEVMAEYEPVKKGEFEHAINQVLKAIDGSTLKPKTEEKIQNIFDEINKDKKKNKKEENLQTQKDSLE